MILFFVVDPCRQNFDVFCFAELAIWLDGSRVGWLAGLLGRGSVVGRMLAGSMMAACWVLDACCLLGS